MLPDTVKCNKLCSADRVSATESFGRNLRCAWFQMSAVQVFLPFAAGNRVTLHLQDALK